MLFDNQIKPREPPPKESKLKAFIKVVLNFLINLVIHYLYQVKKVRVRTGVAQHFLTSQIL